MESRRCTVGMGWARLVFDAREAWKVLRMELEAKAKARGVGAAFTRKRLKGPQGDVSRAPSLSFPQ